MKMRTRKRRCKYCGDVARYKDGTCCNCHKKLVRIRQIIAIGELIRKEAEEDENN